MWWKIAALLCVKFGHRVSNWFWHSTRVLGGMLFFKSVSPIVYYLWMVCEKGMGRRTKRFFNSEGENGGSCLFIGSYGRMTETA